ncbi:MAG: hypothetical protein RLZZ618_911 [Pseudomonadota bacterium]|jgi:AraC-like DNA-binding protein
MFSTLSRPVREVVTLAPTRGRLHAYRNGFLYAGPVIDVLSQRHSVIICFALTCDNLSVWTKTQSLPQVGAVLIAPGYARIDSGGSPIAMLDVSPTDYHYRALAQAAAECREWPRAHFAPIFDEMEAFRSGHTPPTKVGPLWRRFLELALELVPAVKPLDPRVREVMRMLREEPGRPVEDLARAVDLSVDWLRHLFVTEAAIPLRKYEMTLRLQTAAAHIGNGTSLTQVAANAGFADLAHFSKLWKLHYGYPPRRAFAGDAVKIDSTSLSRFEATPPGVETLAGPSR